MGIPIGAPISAIIFIDCEIPIMILYYVPNIAVKHKESRDMPRWHIDSIPGDEQHEELLEDKLPW